MKITLLTDGSSDRALIPIIRWLLREMGQTGCEVIWADLAPLRHKPKTLAHRIAAALELYPCDLLLIHRDAENEPAERRHEEVEQAWLERFGDVQPVGHVVIVPIRMTEAWLLLDEGAIRKAAGNPNGKIDLTLPRGQDVESIHDPKSLLFDLLRRACGLKGRRLKKFQATTCREHVARFTDSFEPLREVPGFERFERDLRSVFF